MAAHLQWGEELFFFSLPNLRLTISKFSNFSSKMLSNLRETRGNIRSSFFCWEFLQPSSKAIEKKSAGSCLISRLWPALPAQWKQALLRPFPTKAETAQSHGTRGRRLMATSPAFPPLDYMFQKDKAWSVFLERKKSLFCDADESRQGTFWNQWRLRLCAEVHSVQTRKYKEKSVCSGSRHFTVLCVSTLHAGISSFSTACFNWKSICYQLAYAHLNDLEF